VSERQAFLVVEVKVMVPLDSDWEQTWTEQRCAEKAKEVHDEIADSYGAGTKYDWWVQG
jgi:hypothetical protein